jgi:rare lipoprotein A
MSVGQLRRHCGSVHKLRRRDISLLMAAVVVPFLPRAASAQQTTGTGPSWVGESGVASVYSNKYQGRRTSQGVRFDQRKMMAAHSWLPFGTQVKVTAEHTGRSVIVTIADRLYAKHCVIDLSSGAARELGLALNGMARVTLSPA